MDAMLKSCVQGWKSYWRNHVNRFDFVLTILIVVVHFMSFLYPEMRFWWAHFANELIAFIHRQMRQLNIPAQFVLNLTCLSSCCAQGLIFDDCPKFPCCCPHHHDFSLAFNGWNIIPCYSSYSSNSCPPVCYLLSLLTPWYACVWGSYIRGQFCIRWYRVRTTWVLCIQLQWLCFCHGYFLQPMRSQQMVCLHGCLCCSHRITMVTCIFHSILGYCCCLHIKCCCCLFRWGFDKSAWESWASQSSRAAAIRWGSVGTRTWASVKKKIKFWELAPPSNEVSVLLWPLWRHCEEKIRTRFLTHWVWTSV